MCAFSPFVQTSLPPETFTLTLTPTNQNTFQDNFTSLHVWIRLSVSHMTVQTSEPNHMINNMISHTSEGPDEPPVLLSETIQMLPQCCHYNVSYESVRNLTGFFSLPLFIHVPVCVCRVCFANEKPPCGSRTEHNSCSSKGSVLKQLHTFLFIYFLIFKLSSDLCCCVKAGHNWISSSAVVILCRKKKTSSFFFFQPGNKQLDCTHKHTHTAALFKFSSRLKWQYVVLKKKFKLGLVILTIIMR